MADIAAPAEARSEQRAGAPAGALPFGLAPGVKWGLGLVLPLALTLGWEAAVRAGLAEGRLMPPPSRIAATLYGLAQTGGPCQPGVAYGVKAVAHPGIIPTGKSRGEDSQGLFGRRRQKAQLRQAHF